jgi:hypothetical protein
VLEGTVEGLSLELEKAIIAQARAAPFGLV